MIEHFLMESPLGTLALVNRNRVLSGLYMPDHLREPKVNSLGSGATSGFDVVRAHLRVPAGRNTKVRSIAINFTVPDCSAWICLNPNASVSLTPCITACNSYSVTGFTPVSTFGTITSTANAYNPRIIQFAARLEF
jgi:hypothetical protein